MLFLAAKSFIYSRLEASLTESSFLKSRWRRKSEAPPSLISPAFSEEKILEERFSRPCSLNGLIGSHRQVDT